ncbi:hypothetical protein ACFV1F_16980 [Streptomyces sp. NPDC059590]|uniref:hypothetical protein n=1 Tax=Streptomyces sp. NPDC059590 TaxID=3346877 RepID=UPI0036C8355D
MQTLTTAMTVNAILYANPADAPAPYSWEPAHPALATLAWEDERTDVHAVIGGQYGLARYAFTCACGFETPECTNVLDASAAIISHALNSCADCGGPKPSVIAFGPAAGQMQTFPRCSRCAL